MDQTDRSDWAESSLFTLYERCFTELERDILRLDPSYRPESPQTIWPHRFTQEEFHSYLSGPVRNSEIRRCWLERLLDYAEPQEQATLRSALLSLLAASQETGGFATDGDQADGSSPRAPHFLSMKHEAAAHRSG